MHSIYSKYAHDTVIDMQDLRGLDRLRALNIFHRVSLAWAKNADTHRSSIASLDPTRRADAPADAKSSWMSVDVLERPDDAKSIGSWVCELS